MSNTLSDIKAIVHGKKKYAAGPMDQLLRKAAGPQQKQPVRTLEGLLSFKVLCEDQLHGWLLWFSQDFVKESIQAGCYDREIRKMGVKNFVAMFFTGLCEEQLHVWLLRSS